MSIVNIDVTNTEELLQQRTLLPNGKYIFEIAKAFEITSCKDPSINTKIDIELKCINDGANKGATVFDRIILVDSSQTDAKAKTTISINSKKLAQLTIAAAVMTKEELATSGGNIPLDQFHGKFVEAQIKTVPATGKYEAKNEVSRYLFDTATKPEVLAG